MELSKNMIIPAKIEDFTEEGEGVARIEGRVVFVKGGVPGDTCEIRILKTEKRLAYAKLERIITPSPARISPDCPHFPACGGCRFRHVDYDAELEYKVKHVTDCLARIGGITLEPEKIIGAARVEGYRNKVQYPVAKSGGRMVYGFFRAGTREVIPASRCMIQPAETDALAGAVVSLASKHGIPAYDPVSGSGCLRHICIRQARDGGLLLCLVTTGRDIPRLNALVKEIRLSHPNLRGISQNINGKNTNVIFGRETINLWGSPTLRDEVAGVICDLSPVSFFQVNRKQAGRLYAKAGEYAGKGRLLLDLYCGTGTIGLSMAENFERVLGIEIVPEAIENARANALLNGRVNAEFICGDAAVEMDRLGFADSRPDVVVVDPPRKGLSPEIIPKIAALEPDRVVYVSCNPATLARDLKLFSAEGYAPKRLSVVDMFPRTVHVEAVVLLTRKIQIAI